jgi:FAD/FMN-containing dehydrogenase
MPADHSPCPVKLGSFGMPAGVWHWGVLDGRTLSPDSLRGARPVVPRGAGQSYGDSAVATHGTALSTDRLVDVLRYQPEQQLITVEAGLPLRDLLNVTLKDGLTPVALPGTGRVTVGGAIAADIHGKNHHRHGTFGAGVIGMELVRDDGIHQLTRGGDLFRATVGGLGLTGLIRSATLRLVPAASHVDVTAYPFVGLREWEDTNDRFEGSHDHVVTWLDPFKSQPQGILLAGSDAFHAPGKLPRKQAAVVCPVLPVRVVNGVTARVVNSLYRLTTKSAVMPLPQFLWPLDRVRGWNRAYGPQGIVQYQFVTPRAAGVAPVEAALALVRQARITSFLTVLKTFGDHQPEGLLSFPMAGYTLALDFPAQIGRAHV